VAIIGGCILQAALAPEASHRISIAMIPFGTWHYMFSLYNQCRGNVMQIISLSSYADMRYKICSAAFRHCVSILSVLYVLSSAVEIVSAAPTYTVTKVNMMPGYISGSGHIANGFDINNSGQVVGSAGPQNDYGYARAFLWSGGSMKDIGALPGFNRSGAHAINSIGQIVGNCANSSNTDRGFLYSGGVMQDLGTLNAPYNYGVTARGINDLGQIVGHATTSAGSYHAFFWDDGTMTDIGTLGGTSTEAFAINNCGQVAGESRTSSGFYHAIRWSSSGMTDLGTLQGDIGSSAYDINASGQTVGSSRTSTGYYSAGHAVLWNSDGSIRDLGLLPGFTYFSIAYGINASGQVVGVSRSSSYTEHAFIYSDGKMADLNDLIDSSSGWTLDFANAINDSGQIACHGTLGDQHSLFVLTPIPEPASLWLIGIAAASLIGCALRRRIRTIVALQF
jgi:probable HAF family extracellular repeat protein